jgi:hypothetical protein
MTRPGPYARALDVAIVLARQSPIAWLAVTLIVASVLAQCAWLPHLRRVCDEESVRLQALRSRHVRAPAPASSVDSTAAVAASRLAEFQAVLGDAAHQEELTRTMFDAAARTGLVLAEGEYTRTLDKSGGYLRLTVSQPMRGTYAQTRAYCDRVLAAVPYAALDDLHFKREGITASSGEALVRWTFYLRSPTGTIR